MVRVQNGMDWLDAPPRSHRVTTWRTSKMAMVRGLTTLLALTLSVPTVIAQPADDDRALVTAPEQIEGYESLLRRYSQMRRIQEAGEVGGKQDGLHRIEIDGLVVDETQTKLARDFYAEFYNSWQAPAGASNYTVVIQEQPVPNVGTRVLVRVNDEIAFQTQLQPRLEVVQDAARYAVYMTYRFVQSLSSRETYVY